MPKSLRKQLPISYAAIALLTVLALGAVLMFTLRNYYTQQERDYLSSNALAVSEILAPLIEQDGSQAAIQMNLNSFALLSQTQIRLLDENEQLIAESGSDSVLHIALGSVPLIDSMPEFIPKEDRIGMSIITIRRGTADFMLAPGSEDMAAIDQGNIFTRIISGGIQPDITFFQAIPVSGDTELYVDPPTEITGHHSNQRVRQPLQNSQGELNGYVELAEGPALGYEILTSVARGWVIAGAVAILLAVAVGWLVSRQISAPLLALTRVTSQMAAGDLAVRADITRQDELGNLARSFNEMAGRVETTVTTLQRFVADAAHALHTPLTALRTNLELAADEKNRIKRQDSIEQAQIQVERLQVLTRGLLDLSRLEANGTDPVREPVDLNGLIKEMSELYASRAEQSGLAFSLETPADPVTVSGNPVQLRQAFGNLLDNAIKFTPQGGHVCVRLENNQAQATLIIEDTGMGVPLDDLPRLFTRFHRGRNASAYPGSGLGLAIVQVIVRSHHGQVSAENTGLGARFTIQLPGGTLKESERRESSPG
ncbi:MAG: HAMP domain-containing histidine kinase [Anaerolineales bacterium]|nr:HAMP domain-containing histidine kinase [Anaerolineales bacterium]